MGRSTQLQALDSMHSILNPLYLFKTSSVGMPPSRPPAPNSNVGSTIQQATAFDAFGENLSTTNNRVSPARPAPPKSITPINNDNFGFPTDDPFNDNSNNQNAT